MAKVLIIDNSQTETKWLTQVLEKQGHDVVTADSGETGVDAAKTELPDLILMDVVMPGMNGFQATRRITNDAATRRIPVVIVTVKDQETDKVWAKRQGAAAFLTKPVSEKVLMDTVSQAISSHFVDA